MLTMAERLRDLLDARQIEPMDLVRAIHVTKAAVYFLLDGTTGADKVRAKTVLDMAQHLRTSADYILFGKGPRDLDPADAKLAELVQLYGNASPTSRDALLSVAKALT
jgi:DNA-binding Xre family transcriptional regulator